jgi:ribosomal protein L24E
MLRRLGREHILRMAGGPALSPSVTLEGAPSKLRLGGDFQSGRLCSPRRPHRYGFGRMVVRERSEGSGLVLMSSQKPRPSGAWTGHPRKLRWTPSLGHPPLVAKEAAPPARFSHGGYLCPEHKSSWSNPHTAFSALFRSLVNYYEH